MAAKKPNPALAFAIEHLKANGSASYKDVAEAARAEGIELMAVLYGLAKRQLGLGKASAGSAKAGAAKAAAADTGEAAGRGAAKGGGRAKGKRKGGKRATAEPAAEPAEAAVAAPRRGRPPGRRSAVRAGGAVDAIGQLAAAIRTGSAERGRYRTALQRIADLLSSALG